MRHFFNVARHVSAGTAASTAGLSAADAADQLVTSDHLFA